MPFRAIKQLLLKIYRRFRRTFELNKYNDFTIERYFRKQGVRVGDNNRIEVRNLGTEPYLISIGNHCTIAPGVSFITHDGATWLFTDEYPSLQKFGTIDIKDNCFIGLNAILMSNITIGPNSIVAAGAVVTKDVPPGTIVGGNPAKVISNCDVYKEKTIKQWNKIKPEGYFEELADQHRYSPEYIQKKKFQYFSMLKKHLIATLWKD